LNRNCNTLVIYFWGTLLALLLSFLILRLLNDRDRINISNSDNSVFPNVIYVTRANLGNNYLVKLFKLTLIYKHILVL